MFLGVGYQVCQCFVFLVQVDCYVFCWCIGGNIQNMGVQGIYLLIIFFSFNIVIFCSWVSVLVIFLLVVCCSWCVSVCNILLLLCFLVWIKNIWLKWVLQWVFFFCRVCVSCLFLLFIVDCFWCDSVVCVWLLVGFLLICGWVLSVVFSLFFFQLVIVLWVVCSSVWWLVKGCKFISILFQVGIVM